jgi:hypothetical protein
MCCLVDVAKGVSVTTCGTSHENDSLDPREPMRMEGGLAERGYRPGVQNQRISLVFQSNFAIRQRQPMLRFVDL